MRAEAGAVGDVPAAQGLGQQDLDLGPEQLVVVVAEELAHLLVDLGDPPAGLHADEGVRGGVEQGGQAHVEPVHGGGRRCHGWFGSAMSPSP